MESLQKADKKTNVPSVKRGVVSTLFVGMVFYVFANVSACSLFSQGRSVYDGEGIRIGVEADPSISRSSQLALNDHPKDLTPKEIEALLQSIQVSGYSGTLGGLVTRPQPVPLFTPQELSRISGHLALAFREAKPNERVSFSLPKPDVTYSEDRTVGSLFFRGRYLHVIVTDHSSIIRTDPGGGEVRDIRDTKGLKLLVAGPIQAAMVPDREEPRWAHFERVHISLPIKEVLARKDFIPAASMSQRGAGSLIPMSVATPSERPQGSTSPDELQGQIRELSGANQDLRRLLDEQNKRMQQLREQVEQLRRELPQSDSSGTRSPQIPTQ